MAVLRKFFYIIKSDRRIILAALTVFVVAVVAVALVGGRDTTPVSPLTDSSPVAAATVAAAPSSSQRPINDGTFAAAPVAERFPFDPNTADSTQLLRLGLQRWQVRNIYKYRAAGGIYRTKADFARLYGLTVGQYRELEPYITIGADYRPAADLFPCREVAAASADSAFTPRYPVKLAEGETIDLSTADTTALQRVPGIGPYYARRIVDYRQRLGGFTTLAQLDEIDGFPQEALPYLTLGAVSVQQLNVNSLSLNDLKRHPYINFYQARAIVDYRRQNGPINDIGDLRLLPDFGDEVIERLRPYITY